MKPAWLISKKAARRAGLLSVVLALLLYTGCATVVRIEDDRLKRAAVTALPPDGEAYLFLDASSSKSVLAQAALSLGGGFGRVAEIIDSIDYIYAAFGMNPETPAWTIIGTGNFPIGTYTFALDFDRGWKRAPGRDRRWISSGGGMEIALPGPQIIVVGSEDTDLVTGRLSGTSASRDTRRNSFFEAVLDKPHPGVVAFVFDLGVILPIDLPSGMIDGYTALVLGDFSGDALVAELIFTFNSPVIARVAGLVIRTMSLADRKKEKGGIFSDARITVDGNTVAVSPVVIESARIVEYIKTVLTEGGENK